MNIAVSRSLSSRRAWIEITYDLYNDIGDKSLSSRRAWIEINDEISADDDLPFVALLAESVD